ncbi:pentatricopeptide repeat-containing protein at1g10270, partial [Phtheirospermum japonicum]
VLRLLLRRGSRRRAPPPQAAPPHRATALRPPPQPPAALPPQPHEAELPDNTTALTGPRLNLHNRVQSLIRAGDLDNASYIARQAVFQLVRPTVFTCNGLIAGMHRAKRYNDAKALFQYFFRQFNIVPNVVSYNTVILAHCESNEVDEALKVYEYLLQNAPFSPSSITYQNLTKGLVDAGRIDEAASLLREMLNKGHGADSSVFNNVILGFLNLGNLDKANELFDELKERCSVYDGKVNATFMDWFFKQGKPKEAMDSYRDLMARNYRMVPATQNVLLETLLRHGKKKEAWDLFHAMLDDHTTPNFAAVNSDTINIMVNECFKEGDVKEAMDVFTRSGKDLKSRPFQMDVPGYNNMIERLCELEMMDEAEEYFKMLCSRQLASCVNTYRILIDTYIKLDRVDDVLSKYALMVGGKDKLRVIPSRANKWFGYVVEKGRASDCLPILSKMAEREPKPDVTTYEIVIRGLVGEGNFDAAANLLTEMTDHGVGTSGSLKEFVLGVFEGLGRQAEIESILNRCSSHYSPQRAYLGPRGPQRVKQGNSGMPWQMGSADRVSNANRFMEQMRQPEMMGQVAQRYPTSEQEMELPPRMAADNAV